MEHPHPITGRPFASPVPPGTGWPDDPAPAGTPAARTAAGVRRLAVTDDLATLDARVSVCAACPRLVRWREDVARDKRAGFADQPYWGRPIAGWGDPEPSVLIVGLAPAAHGGNRTGRIFTGDPSASWLFASLHRVGLARLGTSEHSGDGQRLLGARMVATVRCAPPANKPTPEERDTCSPWLLREIDLVADSVRSVVALGAFGWAGALRGLLAAGYVLEDRPPTFGHGVTVDLPHPERRGVTLLGCYHPSPHNTYTGRLTAEMTDEVFRRALAAGRTT